MQNCRAAIGRALSLVCLVGFTALSAQATAPVFTTYSLPAAAVNVAYSVTVTVTGGASPYTFAVVPATGLPTGLTLNTSTGVISGTPTVANQFVGFEIEVTDSTSPTPQTASIGYWLDTNGVAFDAYGGRMDEPCPSWTNPYPGTCKIGNRWFIATPVTTAAWPIPTNSASHGLISNDITNNGPSASEVDGAGRSIATIYANKYAVTGDSLGTGNNYYWNVIQRATSWGFNAAGTGATTIFPWNTCGNPCPWPGNKIPTRLPQFVLYHTSFNAADNANGFLSEPVKNLTYAENGILETLGDEIISDPDFFDPKWQTELHSELHQTGNTTSQQLLAKNPFIVSFVSDDRDWVAGFDSTPDILNFATSTNIAFQTMVESPVVTLQFAAPTFGNGPFLFQQTTNFMKANATNPATAGLSAGGSGGPGARSEFVQVTYVNSANCQTEKFGNWCQEGSTSAETSIALSAGQVDTVTSPSAKTGYDHYNVYQSTSTGTETLQTASPIALGTNWTQPTSGDTNTGLVSTSVCSINNPCSMRDYLFTLYHGGISALNTAWGSTYTAFDSSGTQVTAESIGTGDGTTTTFTHTLASTPVSPFSVLISVGGTAKIGDYPWFKNAGTVNTGQLLSSTANFVTASTINYSTGAVSITFVSAPANGAAITVNYITGGWMANGTGLMDEDGSHGGTGHNSANWLGTNPFCLVGADPNFPSNFACTGGAAPAKAVPNANSNAGLALDNWDIQYAAQHAKNYHDVLRSEGVVTMYQGINQSGNQGTTSYRKIIQGEAAYSDMLLMNLMWDAPATVDSSTLTQSPLLVSMLNYTTRYAGDIPLGNVDVWNSTPNSSAFSYGGTPATIYVFTLQADRSTALLDTVNFLLTTQGFNNDFQFVEFNQFTYNDFQNSDWGLVGMDDNAYDGTEDVSGSVTCGSNYTVIGGATCGSVVVMATIPNWSANLTVPFGMCLQPSVANGHAYCNHSASFSTGSTESTPWCTSAGCTQAQNGHNLIETTVPTSPYGDAVTKAKQMTALWLGNLSITTIPAPSRKGLFARTAEPPKGFPPSAAPHLNSPGKSHDSTKEQQ